MRFCKKKRNKDLGLDEILTWEGTDQEVWEMEIGNGRYFRINSYPVEWRERSSYVHVVADITKERLEEKCLPDMAYFDSGTGIRNRLFFEEYMEKILQEKQAVTLCYLDIDSLKYVNDHYGHLKDLACRKLEAARTKFIGENKKEYPVSFSYGVYEIDENSEGLTLDDTIREADARMYEYKRENKEKRI